MPNPRPLDVITIGRSSVDLYGAQVGGRLEDMGSFQKYIGGSPTNMAAGTARLGLKSALITRVGNEHMGRFIREELAKEGVDTRGVKTDPERLTALVLLGIRDDKQFPLIFYRENCADMALCEDDIDESFIAEARSVVATGTHLSHPRTEAAVLKALTLARKHGLQTALDIDYRPNLWGLAGHGDGESRFIESAQSPPSCKPRFTTSTSSSAPRKSFTSPAAPPTPSPPCAPSAPCRKPPSSANAGRWVPPPSPAIFPTALTTARPAPASRSRSSTSSAPGTASCPAF
jgi:hypothetical protein